MQRWLVLRFYEVEDIQQFCWLPLIWTQLWKMWCIAGTIRWPAIANAPSNGKASVNPPCWRLRNNARIATIMMLSDSITYRGPVPTMVFIVWASLNAKSAVTNLLNPTLIQERGIQLPSVYHNKVISSTMIFRKVNKHRGLCVKKG